MTIEERAKEYAQSYSSKESTVQWSVERAYGIGAAEQKKMMILKMKLLICYTVNLMIL